MGMMRGVADHAGLGRANYRVHEMGGNPDAQVGQTLGIMRERVLEDSRDPWFVRRAVGLGLVGGSDWETCERVWGHVKRGIRFQRDEVTGDGVGGWAKDEVVEVIIRPVDMARYVDMGIATGDCDDFSMYGAALLTALNVGCSFITVAADGRDPRQFSHVYVIAYPNGERLALDASHGEYPGWETPGYGREELWPVRQELMTGFVGSLAAAFVAVWLWHKLGHKFGPGVLA